METDCCTSTSCSLALFAVDSNSLADVLPDNNTLSSVEADRLADTLASSKVCSPFSFARVSSLFTILVLLSNDATATLLVAALKAFILIGALFVCCETVSVSLVASVSSTDVLSTPFSDVLSEAVSV